MSAWSRFRGPNGTGIGAGTGFPHDGPVRGVAWETALPGDGHSSSIEFEDRIITTVADESRGSAFVVSLEARNGRLAWKSPLRWPGGNRHRFNAAVSSTPVAGNRRIHVFTADPGESRLTTFDTAGNVLWERPLGPCSTQHGGGTSPILVGDSVVVPVEPDHGKGAIWCLDARSGATRWKRERESSDAPYATPMVRRGLSGDEIVLVSTAWGVTALDPRTGATQWESGGFFRQRCVGSPIETRDGILATSGSGGGERKAVLVRPPGKDSRDASVVWTLTRGTSYVPTPVLADGKIVFWGDNGMVHVVDPKDGTTVWQERAGGNFFASPVVANSRVWNVSTSGDLVSFAVGAGNPEFTRIAFGGETHATLAVSRAGLIVRTRGRLFCIRDRAH